MYCSGKDSVSLRSFWKEIITLSCIPGYTIKWSNYIELSRFRLADVLQETVDPGRAACLVSKVAPTHWHQKTTRLLKNTPALSLWQGHYQDFFTFQLLDIRVTCISGDTSEVLPKIVTHCSGGRSLPLDKMQDEPCSIMMSFEKQLLPQLKPMNWQASVGREAGQLCKMGLPSKTNPWIEKDTSTFPQALHHHPPFGPIARRTCR